MCTHCGKMITPTGLCLDCGTMHRKFDWLITCIGMGAILLYPLLGFVANIIISLLNMGATAVFFISWAAIIIPISTGADVVFMARKRAKTHKTTVGLILGIVGIGIGLIFAVVRLFF